MKKGKGGKGERGKGSGDLKALVSSMDTDFSLYETLRANALRALKIFFFYSPYLKIEALYLLGKRTSVYCHFPLSPYPFTFLDKGTGDWGRVTNN